MAKPYGKLARSDILVERVGYSMAVECLEFVLNGSPAALQIPHGKMLADVLRDDLNMKSVKKACEEGECGTCTVIMNGLAVVSCIMPASHAQGTQITTTEGLSGSEALHPLQKAFLEEGALQCGFCTPGMLMSAKALLDSNPRPSHEEIKTCISGNLCRCTGYKKIISAIARAVDKNVGRGEATGEDEEVRTSKASTRETSGAEKDFRFVGESVLRADSIPKVTGRPVYSSDMTLPGMLYGKVVRSSHAHALIGGIDVEAARSMSGVRAVLVASDIPGVNRLGLVVQDQRVLAEERVLHFGEAIALVAAESPEVADEAAKRIAIEYRELPAVLSIEHALDPSAPRVHKGGNVQQHTTLRKGDATEGFRQADVIIENTYRTQSVDHVPLETECSVALYDENEVLSIWTSTQYPFRDRRQIGPVVNLDLNRIRVINRVVGGGFGRKDDITTEIHAALLALATRRPVQLAASREESMTAFTHRVPMLIQCRTGARRDGKLTAVEAVVYGDSGAYASLCRYIVKKAGIHIAGPYYVPHVKVDTYTVYTNNPRSGPMRGFGVIQAAFVHESQMDMLASRLGISPLEIRMKNALDVGLTTTTGQMIGPGAGVKATLKRLEAYMRQNELTFTRGRI